MKFKQLLAIIFVFALGYGLGQQGGILWATDWPRSTGGGGGTHPVNLASDVTGELPHSETSDDVAQVHGLGASVNVLGNRAASGEFVQRASFNPGAAGTVDQTVYIGTKSETWAVAYSATPYIAGVGSSSDANLYGATAFNVSTTAAVISWFATVSGEDLADMRYVVLGN